MPGKKIAISGKGGVGKSTVAALWAHAIAREGGEVIAIDADPDANLAHALGMPQDIRRRIIPLASNSALVEERTGAKAGKSGQMFSLNPKVDDIASHYGIAFKGVHTIILGAIRKGGGGCACPESALLKSLVRYLVLNENETVILDMEAGVEHIGRATAAGVDSLVVVTEAGSRSLETAVRIHELARDIGLDNKMALLLNKLRDAGDDQRRRLSQLLPGIPVIGSIPFDGRLIECDEAGTSLFDCTDSGALLDSFNNARKTLTMLMENGFNSR